MGDDHEKAKRVGHFVDGGSLSLSHGGVLGQRAQEGLEWEDGSAKGLCGLDVTSSIYDINMVRRGRRIECESYHLWIFQCPHLYAVPTMRCCQKSAKQRI